MPKGSVLVITFCSDKKGETSKFQQIMSESCQRSRFGVLDIESGPRCIAKQNMLLSAAQKFHCEV